MRNKFLIIISILACLSTTLCGLSFAQVVRSSDKIDRAYAGFGSDMKYYQIIYELSNDKEYLKYAELIREKIKKELKIVYKYKYGEGDVHLLFILNSNGSLNMVDFEANSTENKKLRAITSLGLKNAAPFPSFPDALPYDQMPFSVVISFQESDSNE